MVGKRHASDEIASKLAHADRLAASGKTQREIAKALGISIMTYHRWKKSADQGDGERRRSVCETLGPKHRQRRNRVICSNNQNWRTTACGAS